MTNSNLGIGSMWQWTVIFTTALLLITFAIYGAAPVSAQAPTPTPTGSSNSATGGVPAPPGDCWAGALSSEAIHCYFLEAAQRAGRIEVAAVYLAAGGGPLYIFLRQTESISDEVADFFEAKAHEYIETEFDAGRSGLPLGQCKGYSGDERKACFNNALGNPSWRDFDPRQSRALPRAKTYEDILLKVGGVDGRRTVPGWRSWSQVWPSGGSGAGGASSGYDVSDVDTTNIPDPDCESLGGVKSPHGRGCNVRFVFLPDLPLAGWENQGDTLFVQYKNPPEDETELKALKDRLVPTWQEDGLTIDFVPVKYDFAELWRWSVILDRFAVSAGNTAGITGGDVTYNHGLYGFGSPDNRPIVWLSGAQPAQRDEFGMVRSTVRTILMVWAVDEKRAAAALPQVLQALGIPADAVSLVAHDDKTPLNVQLAIGSVGTVSETEASANAPATDASNDTANGGPRPRGLEGGDNRGGQGTSAWTIAGGAIVIGTAILGVAIGVSFRLRRRPLS